MYFNKSFHVFDSLRIALSVVNLCCSFLAFTSASRLLAACCSTPPDEYLKSPVNLTLPLLISLTGGRKFRNAPWIVFELPKFDRGRLESMQMLK